MENKNSKFPRKVSQKYAKAGKFLVIPPSKFLLEIEKVSRKMYEKSTQMVDFESMNVISNPIEKKLSEVGALMIRMTRRPFRFTYSIGKCVYVVHVTNRMYLHYQVA